MENIYTIIMHVFYWDLPEQVKHREGGLGIKDLVLHTIISLHKAYVDVACECTS